jgi:DMSO/TMAO reductase YedYZ molybdopterin-dependent catalytic subunit
MTACMFVLRVVFDAPTLPELVQDQVIALVPGSAFGFVIDRLQFVAKPLLLVGLALLGVPFGALVGWLYGRLHRRRGRWDLLGGAACGIAVWLAFELAAVTLGDGFSVALATSGWLLVSAEVYGIALVLLLRLIDAAMEQAAPVDRQRRILVLGGLAGSALIIAGGALARMLASNTQQQVAPEPTHTQPIAAPDSDPLVTKAPQQAVTIPQGVAAEVTPNERFYIVSKNFNDPRVSADKWSLEVFGLVAQPRRFSYEEILALPTVSQYTTLECISNTLGGNLMSNAYWTGVPLSQLVGSLGVQPEARAIIFRSADNYYESFPLEVALASGVLLAHTMNGVPLPDKHGFPLRLILPGRYGVKNPKWITRIELTAEPIEGYWVRRGWDAEALVQTVALIDTPQNNATLTSPTLEIGGMAFAGSRGISRVETSLDGGATWREAATTQPLGASTWVQWALTWDDLSPGTHEVLARANDATGALQTSEENGSFPAGATGYHRARVHIVGLSRRGHVTDPGS